MSRLHPECLDSDVSDRSVAADVLLRQQAEQEEEEDEGNGNGKEHIDDEDDADADEGGYSE
jgi:hypothetical protein